MSHGSQLARFSVAGTAGLIATLMPILALAAGRPPDLVAAVNGEVRVRARHGMSAGSHHMYLQVDRAGNGPGWDEDYDLGILAGTNPVVHTGVTVQVGDRLNVKAASTEGGLTLSYVADRDPRPGESQARIVNHDLRGTVRSCGGGREGPVDVTDLYNSSMQLVSLSCWEGYIDWDFNDYVVAVDYTAEPVFLPLTLREGCTPSQRRMDVVLAIDTSSSMEERTLAGGTKLETARAAAGVFLDLVSWAAGNQAALVTFDAEARLTQSLTADRSRLDIALAAMTTARQTCLPCAVAEADRELASPRRRTGNTPVLVLLTDGKSNPRPVSEAVSAAQTAKDRGVLIFAVGVGKDLDEAGLAAMASQPAYYFRAPDAAALEAIFRAVAVTIPCAPATPHGAPPPLGDQAATPTSPGPVTRTAPPPTITPSPGPTWTAVPTYTPSITPTRPTPTPTPTDLSCTTHTVTFDLRVSDEAPAVGEVITVTARLANVGCSFVGKPGYRLRLPTEPAGMFEALTPLVVEHARSVGPSGDEAAFVLRALRPGSVTLGAWVSFEVHLGFPGPAYWGFAGAMLPVVVTRDWWQVYLPACHRFAGAAEGQRSLLKTQQTNGR